MEGDFRGKVEVWLREMGFATKVVADPDSAWHVQFSFPVGAPHVMHMLIPSNQLDAVLIAMGVNISDAHREGFSALDEEAQETFNWEFRQRLNNIDVEFAVDGVSTQHECPKAYQVMRTRFADGLTKDGLAFSMGAVYKTWLKGLWYVQKELASSGPGPDGRFDFRRLGI